MTSPAKLRVLVDAVSARTGGGGTHIVAQMEALAALESLALTIFATGHVARRLAVACPRASVRRNRSRSLLQRIVWEQLALPRHARGFDVVYMPGNFALFLSPRPQVLTVQNAWYFTDAVRAFRRVHCSRRHRLRLWVESAVMRASIRRADRIIAVSRSMLAAIESDLGPVAHASVVASAPPDLPDGDAAGLDAVGRSFALLVAHDDPHKEWDWVIETFLSRPDLPRLVIAGDARRERVQTLRRRIESRAPGRVHLLGRVDHSATLSALYRRAGCCIAHSRFESFGLTPCEALVMGTPVVATDIPAHREACGSAATYYDPGDREALAEAVSAAVGRPTEAAARTERTWQDNACELERILHDTARRRRAVSARHW